MKIKESAVMEMAKDVAEILEKYSEYNILICPSQKWADGSWDIEIHIEKKK